MIGVEHFSGRQKVEMVLGLSIPREIEEPVEIGPNQMSIRRLLGQGSRYHSSRWHCARSKHAQLCPVRRSAWEYLYGNSMII